MGLINNYNAVLALINVILLSEKYIKTVWDIFTCGAGNDSYKTGECIFLYSMI